jgi:hypothetical protein
MKTLEQKYESVCNEYIKQFCQKHDIDFDGWVANIVGSVCCFDSYFFNFMDIVWDINSKQPTGLIFQWHEDTYENTDKAINYYSYTKGLRYNDLKD